MFRGGKKKKRSKTTCTKDSYIWTYVSLKLLHIHIGICTTANFLYIKRSCMHKVVERRASTLSFICPVSYLSLSRSSFLCGFGVCAAGVCCGRWTLRRQRPLLRRARHGCGALQGGLSQTVSATRSPSPSDLLAWTVVSVYLYGVYPVKVQRPPLSHRDVFGSSPLLLALALALFRCLSLSSLSLAVSWRVWPRWR